MSEDDRRCAYCHNKLEGPFVRVSDGLVFCDGDDPPPNLRDGQRVPVGVNHAYMFSLLSGRGCSGK